MFFVDALGITRSVSVNYYLSIFKQPSTSVYAFSVIEMPLCSFKYLGFGFCCWFCLVGFWFVCLFTFQIANWETHFQYVGICFSYCLFFCLAPNYHSELGKYSLGNVINLKSTAFVLDPYVLFSSVWKRVRRKLSHLYLRHYLFSEL